MKIAIVSDRVYPFFKGGGEKRYWDIAKELIKRGHEIHFYTGQWHGMKKEMKIEGIYLHGVYKVKNFYVNGKKSIKESLIYSLKLFPVLLKADFYVIDCEQMPLFSMFPSKLASIIKSKKLILTWHEAWGKEYWKKYLGKKGILGYFVEKIVVKLPHKIISISNHTTKGLQEKLNVPKENIITIPNGIEFKDIQKVKPSKEKSDIIFAGRLLSHKNVDLLIKSISIIKKSNPRIKTIIIGDGPEKENLVKLVKELKLEKNVKFTGFLPEIEQMYNFFKSSKVFAFPSEREGFGIAVIEALACGLPVVTINHINNASKDLIEQGKNGFIAEFNEKSIVEKIIKAIKSSKSMKQNCINSAKPYEWDKLIDKFEEVYGG